mmetsp:Transcript_40902/g.62317  ORF Transcript_40902/g.62317 Transcript_40902/m.62317 type:complete len:98 (+) Transcript_40902:56-349(+)
MGNHKPATQDSEFFTACQQKKILPMPLFKCIQNNRLRIQSQYFGAGFAECLYELLANNEEASKHVLYLTLDDCKLQDRDFSLLLEGILQSKTFVSSL